MVVTHTVTKWRGPLLRPPELLGASHQLFPIARLCAFAGHFKHAMTLCDSPCVT